MFDIEKAVLYCPAKIEIRLARTVYWLWNPWDIDYYLKESWRWN